MSELLKLADEIVETIPKQLFGGKVITLSLNETRAQMLVGALRASAPGSQEPVAEVWCAEVVAALHWLRGFWKPGSNHDTHEVQEALALADKVLAQPAPSTAISEAAVVSNDAAREKFRADLAEEHLNQIYDYLGCCRSGSAIICAIKEREAALSTSTPPAAAPDQGNGCICQDQHRRGYCTEPGCSMAMPGAPDQGVREALQFDHAGVARRLVDIQEDLPNEEDRAALGYAAHYLGKAALSRPAPDAAGSGWKDISTAPKDGIDILVCDDTKSDGFCQVVFWDEGRTDEWRWSTSDGPTFHQNAFTHWQPLPVPPQSRNERGGGAT